MENERLRRQICTALDDCFAQMDKRPSQKSQIMNRAFMEDRGRRRAPAALVLAVVLLMALSGGAVAAKLGIFSQFIGGESKEWNGQRLERLDEAAQTVGETVHSPEGFSLTLEQAYCDGDRLYFAYTLASETEGYMLGDGASLEDGTSMTIWDRNDTSLDSCTTSGFQEVELPHSAQTSDALTIVLTVFCPNADGTHRYANVPFTVTLAERDALMGSASFAEYSAEAALYVTDVEIYGEVDVFGQAAWGKLYMNRADTNTEDYVVDYRLIADDKVLYNKDYTYGEAEGGYGIPVRFDLPESYESLALRPVRYLSGETEAEDIPLN